MDLYETLGVEGFRRGFLELYQASQDPPTMLGIEHIREAFGAKDNQAVRAIIDHWYGTAEAEE